MESLIGIEPLSSEHFAVAAQWLSAPEINQWLTGEWRGRAVDPLLVGIAVRSRRNLIYLVKCEGRPCGLVALADRDTADRNAMVWYVLGDTSLGGRGIIPKALALVIQQAFSSLDIDALYAWIMEDNVRSRRVLEKAGFREAGRLRGAARHEDRQVARIYFDLIREDVGC